MTTQYEPPLSDAELFQDALLSFFVAIEAMREQVKAGWVPPENSPFRPRETAA